MPKSKKLKKQITYVVVFDDGDSNDNISEDQPESSDSDSEESNNNPRLLQTEHLSRNQLRRSHLFRHGRIAGAFTANPDAVKCETCKETFQDREKKEEHREYFTRSCTFCDGEWIVCGISL